MGAVLMATSVAVSCGWDSLVDDEPTLLNLWIIFGIHGDIEDGETDLEDAIDVS